MTICDANYAEIYVDITSLKEFNIWIFEDSGTNYRIDGRIKEDIYKLPMVPIIVGTIGDDSDKIYLYEDKVKIFGEIHNIDEFDYDASMGLYVIKVGNYLITYEYDA